MLKLQIKNVMIFSALILAFVGCASTQKQEQKEQQQAEQKKAVERPSLEARYAANENDASLVTEIQFNTGSSVLPPEAKLKLSQLVKAAQRKGAVDDFKVIAWSDLEYPSVSTKKLSKEDRDLADQRGKEIRQFLLNQDKGVKIENFNMAERPNAVSDLLGTANARIKKSLEVAGIPNTDTAVKQPSKASKSIVMVIMKD